MKVVLENILEKLFEFNDRNNITLPEGIYSVHYGMVSDEEWKMGERLEDKPIIMGASINQGNYAVLILGESVELWCICYNEDDPYNPYILKSKITITNSEETPNE